MFRKQILKITNISFSPAQAKKLRVKNPERNVKENFQD